MKALTLTEPWASAVAAGIKRIETRSWAAARELIGRRIAIHAAKGMKVADVEFSCSIMARSAFHAAGETKGQWDPPGGHCSSPTYAFRPTKGRVLATATLADCVRFGRIIRHDVHGDLTCLSIDIGRNRPLVISDIEYGFGDFSPGRFGFILNDLVRLPEPIPATGALGFWEWTPPVEAEGRAA